MKLVHGSVGMSWFCSVPATHADIGKPVCSLTTRCLSTGQLGRLIRGPPRSPKILSTVKKSKESSLWSIAAPRR